MTERTSFYRKLAYLGAIVILAFPIVWLSLPATTSKEGGKLAQLRKNYRLAQVNLGDVDPASETIKLATLGLRGVAVNLLWEQANYYKKVEDWTNLTATLEQLAMLQPNFITFWKFQAWNLTYNVSVEFDDYRERYYYVRRGIQFLQKGERYNADNPQLIWDLGWFVGQKIGRADEYVQYRRLFKADDDFHPPDRTMEERDNWLVGKEWYKKAIDAVDNKGQSLGRKSPRDFYSSPSKSQMNYAEAIEEEGFFERARLAWQRAAEEWRQFGNTFIEHSTGVRLQLGAQQRLEKVVLDLRAKLDAMQPDVRKKLAEEKRNALPPEERQILDTPKEKLTAEQSNKLYTIGQKIAVSDRDVAQRIARDQPAKANQAFQLASDLDRESTALLYTENYKRDANYDYWENRANFEQTQNAIDARTLMFQARKAYRDADVAKSRKLYEEGFAKWRAVIDAFPMILDDDQTTGSDILDFVKHYRRVLDQYEEHIGEDFPLWDVIEKFDKESDFAEEKKEHDKHKTPSAAGTAPAAANPATPAAETAPAAAKPATPAPKPAAETKTPAPPKPATPPAKPAANSDSKKK
jgi:cell division septation protein DedD